MLAPPARALFTALIDYAGLYPPVTRDMQAAVSEYDKERSGSSGWMLGRFIIAASRIEELLQEINAYQRRTERALAPFALSVIVDAVDGSQPWLTGMKTSLDRLVAPLQTETIALQVLEVPLPRLASQRDTYDATIGQFVALASTLGMRSLPTYVELPRDERWHSGLPDAMTVLARYRCGAKVRCGGVSADAFPSPEELAAFIVAATNAKVPFKATAGLHHPLRGLDPAGTGFMMHGFLNVLVAALVARDGADAITVEAAIGEEDANAFRIDNETIAWRDQHFDIASIEAMRSDGFVAYGSCSISEPVEDLTAIGMLSAQG